MSRCSRHDIAETGDERHRAQGLENVVGPVEIGFGLLDDAAQRFEDAALRVHLLPDAAVDRQSAQILPPRDANALEIAIERKREAAAWFAERDGRSRVRARECAQQQSEIADAARHRTVDAQRGPTHRRRPCRHAARRRPHAHDVAEAGRIAQRAAHVGPVGDRDHPAGERRGAAAGAASACFRRIVGIERGAEHGVEGLRPGAKFRRVRLADDHRSGALDALDEKRAVRRHEILEDGRTERRANTGRRLQILVRDRQPVQRTEGRAASLFFVGAPGGGHRLLGNQGDDGVDGRVDAFDLFQVRGEDFTGGELLRADEARHVQRAEPANLGHHTGDAPAQAAR